MDDVITDKKTFLWIFFPRFALGHIPEMLLIKVKGTLRCCDFQKNLKIQKNYKNQKSKKNPEIEIFNFSISLLWLV